MNPLAHLVGHFFRCKDVSRLISQGQDRELSAFERAKIHWHLAICKACMAFDRQMRLLGEAMRRYRQ